MKTDKTSVQLIDDVSTYTGEVSFRLRYTNKGKILKNIKLPFTAPAKINKKDVKAVMTNPFYKKAMDALIEAKKELGQDIKPINKPNDFIGWGEYEASLIQNERSRQKMLLIFTKLKAFTSRVKVNFDEIDFTFCMNFQTYLHKNIKGRNHAAELFRKYMMHTRRAKKQGLITIDLSGIKRIQIQPCYKVGVTLTESETNILFNTPCPDRQTEVISKLQYYTGGQRISDILALTWDMIEKQGDHYTIPVLVQEKTSNKVYDIILSADLVNSIKGERKGKVIKGSFDWKEHNNILDKWVELAEIDKKIRSHCFRRTAATHLFRNGVNIVTIAKVLGHCSKSGIPNPMQTMQYIGVQPDDMKPVFTALQGITQTKVKRVA